MSASTQRLAKWRTIFAGWQLGTRAKTDPESCAVVDHREVSIMMRVEVSAIANLLIKKGVFTLEEFQGQLDIESQHLMRMYEHKFPGYFAEDYGMRLELPLAAETARKFHFPP